MSLALLIVRADDKDGFVELKMECDDHGSLAEHVIMEMVKEFLDGEDDVVN